jgi:AbrB family looped-hinge helix DNA binding protein
MMSTVTKRGQTAIPAAIRRHYNIAPNTRIEWVDDGHSIAVIPVSEDSIKSLRGKYKRYDLGSALSVLRMEERKK